MIMRTLSGLYRLWRIAYGMYLTGATITFIIHIFFDFVKLMYKFFENSYENTEKNRVCQSLLQLVNVPIRYLYWRYGYKNISRSHREAVYEELRYRVMVSPIWNLKTA